MTIEQLLNCSADKLEAMTDEDLTKHFLPFMTITRPELAAKEREKAGEAKPSTGPKRSSRLLDDRQQKAIAIAKQMGLDIESLF